MTAEPQISLLLDFLKEIRPLSVCEIGCNWGRELNEIPGVIRYGIDKNRKGLEKVKGETICACAEGIPLKDSFIDVVYSMGCLSHIQNPVDVINEMFRISKSFVILLEWIGTKTGKDFTNCKQNSWIHDYERLVALKGEVCFNKKRVFGSDLFHIVVVRKRREKKIFIENKKEPLFLVKIGKLELKVGSR